LDGQPGECETEEWLREPFVIFVSPRLVELNTAYWLVYREEVAGKAIMSTFCCVFGFSFLATLAALTDNFYEIAAAVEQTNSIFFVDSLIVAGPTAIITSLIAWQLLKRRALRTYGDNLRFHQFMFYRFASSGFQIQNPQASVLIEWQKVRACIEIPESLCLIAHGYLHTLPKRCFWSEQQFKNIRKLIINQGVNYNSIGKTNSEQQYALSPPKLTIEIGEEGLTALLDELDSGNLNTDFGETLSALQTGHFSEPHPQSSLISEPLAWQQDAQPLNLECHYTLTELKAINRLYFFKCTLPHLGWRYIAGLGVVCIAPSVICYMLDFPLGVQFFVAELLLLLPFLMFFTWHIVDLRTDKLIEFLKLDTPIWLELTEHDCRMKSRRSFCVYAWPQFKECISTREHYLCRLPIGLMVIPKRVLDDRIKRAYVENLLRSKIRNYQEWN